VNPPDEPPDRDAATAFSERLFGIYTSAVLSLMIDLGHRLDLFTTAASGPATSTELAARAGLDERYVREWLGAMATSGILTFDPTDRRYVLPPEHAAALTGPTSTNQAPRAAMATLLGRNLDGIEAAFRHGGGVPYSAFAPEFTGVMDGLHRRPVDELLVDRWLPVAPELVRRLSAGARVADVGCGTGHAINVLAAAFPASRFVGFDLSESAIERAREETAGQGLTNADFVAADLTRLAERDAFDVVFAFDAVHDQADPARVLRNIRDALAPDGTFFMFDIAAASDVAHNLANPYAPWTYSISTLHCMTVSLAEGGAGLGAAWGEELARQLLAEAGFTDVAVTPAPGEESNLIYVSRRA
jgi:SAM-dependent methyltransferase